MADVGDLLMGPDSRPRRVEALASPSTQASPKDKRTTSSQPPSPKPGNYPFRGTKTAIKRWTISQKRQPMQGSRR